MWRHLKVPVHWPKLATEDGPEVTSGSPADLYTRTMRYAVGAVEYVMACNLPNKLETGFCTGASNEASSKGAELGVQLGPRMIVHR